MAGGVAPSIPKADFSADGAGTGAALPFSSDSVSDASDIVVLFKVCGNDEEITRRVAGVIERQMRAQRVGARGIAVVISNDSVEMSTTTKQTLAAMIAPLVASALGVTLR